MRFVFEFFIRFIDLYKWLLFARILLSWMPAIDWYKQPWRAIFDVTEPVMAPFRKLIPPIGGVVDVSPLILFLAIDMLMSLLTRSFGSFGF